MPCHPDAIHQRVCTSASHRSLAGMMLSQKSNAYWSKLLLPAIAGPARYKVLMNSAITLTLPLVSWSAARTMSL